jgi:DNA repair ATPase RecN
MNPLGIGSLPADVMSALRVLPLVAERLELIAAHTEHLPTIRRALEGVQENTGHLPQVEEAVRLVSNDTRALASLNDRLGAMDGRMASIEEAMPVLVDVQQHLARLPEAIEALQSGIDRLCGLMEGLHTSMDRLDGDIGSLQQSIEPVARVADRLPGGGRRQT